MNDYSIYEVATIIGGELIPSASRSIDTIKIIATDSRTIISGKQTIFFALVSDRNNAHKYIPELIKKGVKTFVISEKHDYFFSTNDVAFIYVKDTLEALQELAINHRNKFSYPVIGIAGSNGKTIIKEWLYDILKDDLSIARSPKSYNSQIGVPLSAWLLSNTHNLAILEAGISKPGEMEKLQNIIKPTIGIFTNIGAAHQENFSGLKQKLNEKIILFKDTGKLIFSADQEESSTIIKDFCNSKGIIIYDWSACNKNASIQFNYKCKKETTDFDVKYKEEAYSFSIPFTDSSAIENACHCFTTALAMEAPATKIQARMGKLSNVAMRLEIKQGNNDCLLINDFYNSDINSLSIALSVLNNQAKKGHLKKIIFLSDIQQSGTKPLELYQNVNQMITEAGVNKLIGIGPDLFANQTLFDVESNFYRSTDDFLRQFNDNQFRDAVLLLKGARIFNFENIASKLQQKAHQTILEISLDAMVENLNSYRSLLKSSTKVMAMVKAFSYGSGGSEIANLLQYHKIDYLAVAVSDEGIELRKSGITIPIIVMNPESQSFQNIIDYQLEPNIYRLQLLRDFISHLKLNALFDFPVHIKIDSGMNRLGFKKTEEIENLLAIIKDSNIVHISSVFSHLSASDDPGFDSFTHQQIDAFNKLSRIITKSFGYKIDLHILNSAGIERFPEYQFDMVRLGIGLYGISCKGMPLANISTLKTTISQIKQVGNEETIGYSRKGKLPQNGRIAVIPVGYADGLRRILGNNNGRAFVKGQYVPIVGNVCMDMCMLDVSQHDVNVGDEVEIFGDNIPVSELAEKTNTIPYEILTGISQRVKRVYIQE